MKHEKMAKAIRSPFMGPLILLILCILAYGLLIPTLGYYWDDLPYAWINHMYGPAGYPDFVALDRPYSAWIFMGLTAIWGQDPIGYHISSLLLFWLCACLFWALMRLIWPTYAKEALWASMLFAIYPGFLGQPNAIIYNHHFTAMALYLFSLLGMVKAVQNFNKTASLWRIFAWHVPSVLALSLSQFSIEYFLGWEAVRPIIIWIVLQEKTPDFRQKIKNVVLHLAPYWAATIGFLFWRVVIFEFPTYQPLGGGETDLISRSFLRTILEEIVDVVIVVWRRAFPQTSSGQYSFTFWLLYLAVTIISAGFVFVVQLFYQRHMSAETDLKHKFGLPTLLIALIGIFFAGWPFWLSGLSVRIEGPFFSRFTMAYIPWVALLITVCLYSISSIRIRGIKTLQLALIALLVGGSTGWHLWNTNLYRNDWFEVQRYFQQMVRRIPDLEPGTTLIINDMPFLNLYSDNSMTTVLNWTYSPENTSREMDYMMYYLSVRLGRGLTELEPGLPIEQPYRSLHFSGSTDQLLVVYYSPPGCLRVLDENHPGRIPSTFPQEMMAALPLSKLSMIITDPLKQAEPPEHLFDLEPAESWCRYFEEADLASQQGDWAKVAALGDIAFKGEDQSNEITELFVFIEGYLRTGRLDSAYLVSQTLSERSEGVYDQAVCNLWQQVERDSPNGFDPEFDISSVYGTFCSP